MVSYCLEVEKRRNEWAVYLWRRSFWGSDIIKSEYRNTKEEIDSAVEMMKVNKDRYIREYEEGRKGHQYIKL